MIKEQLYNLITQEKFIDALSLISNFSTLKKK